MVPFKEKQVRLPMVPFKEKQVRLPMVPFKALCEQNWKDIFVISL